jgi:signal transduction histidine kinase
VYPPLVFVALALPAVFLLSLVTGSRLAGRVERLHQQVDRIAAGDFQQFDLPAGNDEIRSLAEAVNRMAAMLASYEVEVRRTERMRTLAHLGGGIAHQLRNSATGCAMAVDLHAAECPLGKTSESLSVAKRQLRLMEEYIQRFLQLGKPSESTQLQQIDLAALAGSLLPLVQPAARHAGVALICEHCDTACMTVGNSERLGQVMINLLVNAIESASHVHTRVAAPAEVRIDVRRQLPDRVLLTVSDTGPGPAESVQHTLFEPFVTEKPNGVGLGLSVAREVVEQHGGRIDWHRTNGITHFVVDLPSSATEGRCVEAAGCR